MKLETILFWAVVGLVAFAVLRRRQAPAPAPEQVFAGTQADSAAPQDFIRGAVDAVAGLVPSTGRPIAEIPRPEPRRAQPIQAIKPIPGGDPQR